jgi:protein gp37
MEKLAIEGWLTWVSNEPSLEAIDWDGWEFIRWMVSGGESGSGARPSHPAWHRATRDWCEANHIAYFFKQWGAWTPVYSWARAANVDPVTGTVEDANRRIGAKGLAVQNENTMFRVGKKAAGRQLDGRTHDEYPA